MATNFVTCPNCSTQNSGLSTTCMQCGRTLPIAPMPMQATGGFAPDAKPAGADKKITAGICGIVLGGFGVHKFILGYQQEGIILLSVYVVGLILTIVTCGLAVPIPMAAGIVGLIEGIIYLTKSDEEFVQTYIVNKKAWF